MFEPKNLSFRYEQNLFVSINQYWVRLAPHIYQVSGNFMPSSNILASQKALLLPIGMTINTPTANNIFALNGTEQKLVFSYSDCIEFIGGATANENYSYNLIFVTNEP